MNLPQGHIQNKPHKISECLLDRVGICDTYIIYVFPICKSTHVQLLHAHWFINVPKHHICLRTNNINNINLPWKVWSIWYFEQKSKRFMVKHGEVPKTLNMIHTSHTYPSHSGIPGISRCTSSASNRIQGSEMPSAARMPQSPHPKGRCHLQTVGCLLGDLLGWMWGDV